MVALTPDRNTKMSETFCAASAQMYNSMPVVLIAEDNADCRLMIKLRLER
jgi:hypothetical protein